MIAFRIGDDSFMNLLAHKAVKENHQTCQQGFMSQHFLFLTLARPSTAALIVIHFDSLE